MKFPSLFKIPRHQRFQYVPRYYDEIKEDIKERTERIRKELELEGKIKSTDTSDTNGLTDRDLLGYRNRIMGSFARNGGYRRRSQESVFQRSGLLKLIIFLLLGGFFVGYLFYGNNVLYALLALAAVYILIRVKQIL